MSRNTDDTPQAPQAPRVPSPPPASDALREWVERAEDALIRSQVDAPPVPDLNSSDVDDQGRVYRRK
jgi:hypothetical protein